jgi:hypothetical protein
VDYRRGGFDHAIHFKLPGADQNGAFERLSSERVRIKEETWPADKYNEVKSFNMRGKGGQKHQQRRR